MKLLALKALLFAITALTGFTKSQFDAVSAECNRLEDVAIDGIDEDVNAAWNIVVRRFPVLEQTQLSNLIKQHKAAAVAKEFAHGQTGNMLNLVLEAGLFIRRALGFRGA